MSSSAGGERTGTDFSYNTFVEWYSTMEKHKWRPAEVTITRLLNEHLDRELSDFTRNRIQVTSSRVKDAARAWKKLGREKYKGSYSKLDDVPRVIDDLVGVRITCNNLSDVQYLVSTLGGLPFVEDASDAPLAVYGGRDADYLSNPKPSGYRAYHINLCVQVPGVTEMHSVPVELQIRTRLQDSWGELTHEDTYKPEMELPEIIEPLARRMADLLAVVDNIAQDIRDELDRRMADLDSGIARNILAPAPPLVAESLSEPAGGVPTDDGDAYSPSTEVPGEVPGEVLEAELRRMVADLTKPAAMAELAQALISLFGPEIASNWGGFSSFKELMSTAVPDAQITNVGPSYVAPPNMVIPERYRLPVIRSNDESATPEVVLQLKSIDAKVPTWSGATLGHFLVALRYALKWETWDRLNLNQAPLGLATVNILSRDARDVAQAEGRAVSRINLDWALKAFLWSGNLRPGWSYPEIATVLSQWILSRAASQGIPVDPMGTSEEVYNWFVGGLADAEPIDDLPTSVLEAQR